MMNIQNMMTMFRGFAQNPMGFMMNQKLNIPQQYANDPQGAIQYLMNTGKITQEQYNMAVNQAKQLQNNPDFMKMLQGFGNMKNRQ